MLIEAGLLLPLAAFGCSCPHFAVIEDLLGVFYSPPSISHHGGGFWDRDIGGNKLL